MPSCQGLIDCLPASLPPSLFLLPEALPEGPGLADAGHRLAALRQQEGAERQPTTTSSQPTSVRQGRPKGLCPSGARVVVVVVRTYRQSRILRPSVARTTVTLGDSFEINVCTSSGWQPNCRHHTRNNRKTAPSKSRPQVSQQATRGRHQQDDEASRRAEGVGIITRTAA